MRWLFAVLFVLSGFIATASAHTVPTTTLDIHLDKSDTKITLAMPLASVLSQPGYVPAGTTDTMLRGNISDAVRSSINAAIAERMKVRTQDVTFDIEFDDLGVVGQNLVAKASLPAIYGKLLVRADLFPVDTIHLTLANIFREGDVAAQYALTHSTPSFLLDTPTRPTLEIVTTFIEQGIHHIFIGPDHILFVISLLLLGGALFGQLKVITAFTLAHSITLTLATFHIVTLPSRLVESIIAFSIVVVAVYDIWKLRKEGKEPVTFLPRATFAFVFGLIHGFGFASVLQDLPLPRDAMAWSLGAFNIGVEIGQVAIVLVVAPILYLIRRFAPVMLSRIAFMVVAAAVALMGGTWFIDRAFDLGLDLPL